MAQADVVTFHQVTHFVSTIYDRSHFAVLLFDLEVHCVTMYDSLPCDLKKWENHISYILQKDGLQDYKDMLSPSVTTGTDGDELLLLFFSDENEGPLLISKDPKLKQYDGINCGPIACLKVMEIYGIIPKNTVDAASIMHEQGYCGIVLEYYNRFMKRYEPDIWYNVSGALDGRSNL
jgi:hypothetical protein